MLYSKNSNMKGIPVKKIFFLSFLAICFAVTAHAEGSRDVRVDGITGTAEFQKAGAGAWAPLTQGTVLQETDVVKTGPNSTCSLTFIGMSNAAVDVKPDSVMELATVGQAETGDHTELDLSVGSVLVKAEKLQGESSFQVRTPNSIVGIRGTEFEVKVD